MWTGNKKSSDKQCFQFYHLIKIWGAHFYRRYSKVRFGSLGVMLFCVILFCFNKLSYECHLKIIKAQLFSIRNNEYKKMLTCLSKFLCKKLGIKSGLLYFLSFRISMPCFLLWESGVTLTFGRHPWTQCSPLITRLQRYFSTRF